MTYIYSFYSILSNAIEMLTTNKGIVMKSFIRNSIYIGIVFTSLGLTACGSESSSSVTTNADNAAKSIVISGSTFARPFFENVLEKYKKELVIPFYIEILNNICCADYTDRITFQKQIWIFNEMSSLIKSFYNSFLFQKFNKKNIKFNPTDVRFTKVLTKYSTEYNNILFIQKLCEQLNMDREDMFCYFLNLKNIHSIEEIYTLFENDNYDISKLDINRIYKYLNIYSNYEYLE